MDTKLYGDLKHCWKMGYKLPKIKEYCETDYSLDELQELFMEMWESELEKINSNLMLHSAIDKVTSELDCITDVELQSKFDEITDFSVSNAINGVKWSNDLVSEDQAMGLYKDPRYKDHTDSQIADLYNFMDASFRCVGITHWQDNKGDKL